VPRGLRAAELIERMRALPADRCVEALESVPDALDAALAACRPEQTVVVFGSFITAAAALQALERRRQE
jgi:folylpolyglutamate synthase/dihydropteroate synthase